MYIALFFSRCTSTTLLIDQSTGESRFSNELEKLQNMTDYCHTEQCLQSFILQYFGEEPKEDCGRCGNCTDDRESIDVTRESQMVLSCMIRTNQRFGKQMIAQVLTGSKNKKVIEFNFHTLPTYGLLSNRSVKEVSEFIEFLISDELIAVEHGTYPTLKVTEKGKEVLLGKENVLRKERVEQDKSFKIILYLKYFAKYVKKLRKEKGYLHSLFSLTKR